MSATPPPPPPPPQSNKTPHRIETKTARTYRQKLKKLDEEEAACNEVCKESTAKVEEAVQGIVQTALESKKFPTPKRSG